MRIRMLGLRFIGLGVRHTLRGLERKRTDIRSGATRSQIGEKLWTEPTSRAAFAGTTCRLGIDWSGTPEWIRTTDLLLRRQTLYPAELRAHRGANTIILTQPGLRRA